MKKLTTQEFIERAIKTHGDAYDYSETNYKTAKDKVKIFCKVHSEFFRQSAIEHTNGHGCPKCATIRTNSAQSKTQEQFIADAIAVHGDHYDYADTEYKSGTYKVRIKCNKHNYYFTQTAKSHLAGRGCPSCGVEKFGESRASNQERFLESAALVHGTRYIYDKTVYTRSDKKVVITCRVHGDYKQSPDNHLIGRGCPSCARAGYSPIKPGYLYLLQCGDITKIGITNISPDTRATSVSKSFGAEFSVKHSWEFEDGSIPDEIETALLRELRKEYDRPVNKFDGSSECFLSVDHTILLSRINQEIELRMQ